jgi:hypothetical protein
MKNITIKGILIFIFVIVTGIGLDVARAGRLPVLNHDLAAAGMTLQLQLSQYRSMAEAGTKTTCEGGGLENNGKATNL